MELGKNGKKAWWIVLVLAGVLYLYSKRETILHGTTTGIDILVILAWIALLLSPLFSELDIFGFKIRRELQDIKHDLNSQILDLRSEIHNQLSLNATISPSFHFHSPTQPAPDYELERADPYLKKLLYDTLKSYGVADRGGGEDISTTPDNSKYLFGIRYNLEKRLRKIWEQSSLFEAGSKPVPISPMLTGLVKAQILDPDLAYMIREVYTICSAAIHDVEVSEEQARFVRSNSPSLFVYLDALISNI